MDKLVITLPDKADLNINILNKNLYIYDFNSYNLASLQEIAGLSIANKIKNIIFNNSAEIQTIQKVKRKNDPEYVAQLSETVKQKLAANELQFVTRKETGETSALLKNSKTGKIFGAVNLDRKVEKNIGDLTTLITMQSQLNTISDQLSELNNLVVRMEQGQYNDRFSGFFSSRQLLVEAIASKNDETKQSLLINATVISNQTVAQLMLSINQDTLDFVNMKTKPKDAKRINALLQQSIGYLNSSIQINLVAYSLLEEEKALTATLLNYQSFLEQTLLKKDMKTDKSIAWMIDNIQSGFSGKFTEISTEIVKTINGLTEKTSKNLIEAD
ncbi:hypothetical protein [Lactiplantibacillus plantarum]|uniref:hypothetical protein n=1 Tax=Lactiplantibacillus plantarum TaxID=1590 RepID=UPI000DAB977F|nr:hypothetical protein [Lactiplantibacillus plantarum]KAF1281541.1 hypothetical protein CHF38_14600 [Lactiplantibacillus plantarum]RAH93889.1 hypothetical protein DAY22_14600 [Lactiplantibacillus plantarum]